MRPPTRARAVVSVRLLTHNRAGLFFYRTGEASIIHSEQLDEEYAIVFLYVPRQKRRRLVGSTYYLGLSGLEGAFEIAHPYISFQVSATMLRRQCSRPTLPFFAEPFRPAAAARVEEPQRRFECAQVLH